MTHTPINDDEFYVAVGTMVEYTGDNVADICTCNPALFGQEKVAPSLEQQCANADFIARACNSHDEMLHEMKELAKALEDTGHEPPQSFYDAIRKAEQ